MHVARDTETVAGFLEAFAAVVARSKSATVDVDIFESLLDTYKQNNDMHISNLARFLQGARNYEGYGYLARALLYSSINAGGEHSTQMHMITALKDNKTFPGLFKSPEYAKSHQMLLQLANGGGHFASKVLAGKIAHEQGNQQDAIYFFRASMDDAVAESVESKKKRDMMSRLLGNVPSGVDFNLTTPWVELQSIYLSRREYENARWAIAIGCEQDDPNSHYAASLFEKDPTLGTYTSKWLYHITKAASTGHVRAMHALGLWYAETGWPYIDDEPPDRIKPTPFDRFPSEPQQSNMFGQSFGQKLKSALGLSAPADEDISWQTFHSAAYPTTPSERFGMALQWLKIAMGFNYAPSFLAAAQLHLEKTLFSDARTPKVAVNLSKERYSYESRADWELSTPIKRELPPEEDIPNPYYDPDQAKTYVREIFYAERALKIELNRIYQHREAAKQAGIKNSYEDAPDENALPQNYGTNLKKWYRYPDSRELFMDDRTGKLIDRERNDKDLLEEAQWLCEEQKWDIYADDGGLLYRHGMKK